MCKILDKNHTTERITPFLKWAGGKRWLTKYTPELFPKHINTYYEPFLGSGAIFFSLRPHKAVLSDINAELIDTYKAIKYDFKKVVSKLRTHQNFHSNSYYYKIRNSRPRSLSGRAARMLYLNRTCWNALYRVNLNGIFNVPKGTKNKVVMPSDNFSIISKILSNKEILCQDFERTINEAQKDDFIFVDPPYTVMHNNNGFIKYNDSIFEWNDQVRLAESIRKASKRGAKILVTNACHESIINLYSDFPRKKILSRSSVLASDVVNRRPTEELVIFSW